MEDGPMSLRTPTLATLALYAAPALAPAAGLPGKTWNDPGRTDLHGDLLPPGALARLGTVRWRHGAAVRSVAFAPDGKVLAALDADGGIRLWERGTGRELRRWKQGSGHRGPLAFSPDGRVLASGDGGVVHLWDSATGAERRRLVGHQGTVHCLAFSPDGRTLASGAVEGLQYVGQDVVVAKRSPGDRVLRLWDVTGGSPAGEVVGHEDGIETVAFSPDGTALASGGWDRTIRVWDARTGSERQCFTGSDASIGQLLFLYDGRTLVSAGDDHTLRFWDTRAGKPLRGVGGGPVPVDGIALSPDGKTLASSGGGVLRLWDAATGEDRGTPLASPTTGPCVAFAPDGKLLAAAAGHAVGLWDPATGRPASAVPGHHKGVTTLRVRPAGRAVLTAGADGVLWAWAGRGQAQGRLDVPATPHHLAVSPDGRTLAVSNALLEDRLRLVDLATGRELRQITLSGSGSTAALAFSPDGRTVARAATWYALSPEGRSLPQFALSTWDLSSGEERGFGSHPGRPSALAFAPDGKRLFVKTGEPEPTLRTWDAATARELRPFTPGPVPGERCAFAPDGGLLAVFGEPPAEGCPPEPPRDRRESLQLWEACSGRPAAHVCLPTGAVDCVAFAPDGRLLAFGDRDRVRLWDVATWTERAVLRGHGGKVNVLAFGPDGRTLVTGSDDTTALVWDLDRLPPPPRGPAALPADRLEALWEALAGADAARGWQALGALAAAPEHSVPFLRSRLRPAPPVTPGRLAQLIGDLDSADFAVRERASEELELLGERAETALRRAAARSPSAEVRRRAGLLLAGLRGPGVSSEELRAQRAALLLRHIDTAEARQVAQLLEAGRGP
jgi:WD40 repeat protein